jgi:hypothetical protein
MTEHVSVMDRSWSVVAMAEPWLLASWESSWRAVGRVLVLILESARLSMGEAEESPRSWARLGHWLGAAADVVWSGPWSISRWRWRSLDGELVAQVATPVRLRLE